jgi:hypothetical protein
MLALATGIFAVRPSLGTASFYYSLIWLVVALSAIPFFARPHATINALFSGCFCHQSSSTAAPATTAAAAGPPPPPPPPSRSSSLLSITKERRNSSSTTSVPMAAPMSKCLHVQTTWTYLTYLQYFSTPGGMYYSICKYYSIYNLSVISDAKFLCRGTFCVGPDTHVDPNLATFQHAPNVSPTCCRHCQLSWWTDGQHSRKRGS